jgi:hypothetical protein
VVDDPNTLLSDGNCGVGDVESGGGLALSVSPPAPLTASDPAPEHGRPVIGFVPVVSLFSDPGLVPGVAGEIGTSACWGTIKVVIGFTVCADAVAFAAKTRIVSPISCNGLAAMDRLLCCHPPNQPTQTF